MIGDSKWFVKRKDQLQKAKEAQAKQQAQLLQMQKNQMLVDAKMQGAGGKQPQDNPMGGSSGVDDP